MEATFVSLRCWTDAHSYSHGSLLQQPNNKCMTSEGSFYFQERTPNIWSIKFQYAVTTTILIESQTCLGRRSSWMTVNEFDLFRQIFVDHSHILGNKIPGIACVRTVEWILTFTFTRKRYGTWRMGNGRGPIDEVDQAISVGFNHIGEWQIPVPTSFGLLHFIRYRTTIRERKRGWDSH